MAQQSSPSESLLEAASESASRYGALMPYLVLLLSLAATFLVWTVEERAVDRDAKDYFDFRANDAAERIENRLKLYEQALRGAQALFISSGKVSRGEFGNYVSDLNLNAAYPGIQGIGFALAIPPSDLGRDVAAVRRQGFPDYAVRPSGVRDFYTAIVYLEPFDWRNKRAFGYDMYSESARRKAMEQARDTGKMAMSGKVVLVQETGRDVQAGFLMYLPVYKIDAPHATLDERRANLLGWVYSVFRMGDLMSGIFGNRSDEYDIHVYDGDGMSDRSMMYDFKPGHMPRPKFVSFRKMQVANHVWTIRIASLAEMESRFNTSKPAWIAGGGILISLMLALVTWMQVSGRRRALLLAFELNRDLIESRKALQRENEKNLALLRNASDGIHILDAEGKVIEASDSFCSMLGYGRSEVIGMSISQWDAGFADRAALLGALRRQFERPERSQFETLHRRKDGTVFEVEVSGFPLELDGMPVLFNSSRDITERRQAEQNQATLSRAYRLLSECGILLLHSTDESELLNEICRLTVETGGYLMAWVGIPDPDKSVRPVARSGHENSYLDRIRVTWDETETGNGPTGLAIRTGKTQVNQNCSVNSNMVPWKEAAESQGYNASIALPLLEGNQAFGVLTLYAKDPNAFGESEVRLLDQLAQNVAFGVLALRDRAVRDHAESMLRINASVFDTSQEGILITDADNVILDVNPAFTSITGYEREEVIGRKPNLLSSGRQDKAFYEGMWRSLNENGAWRGEIWNRKKTGEVYAELLSVSAIRDEEGRTIRHVGVFADINDLKRHEAELSRIAHYDALTGIPNRALLADRMKQAIAQTRREHNMMAVCYLDLDGFKTVNDTMGHEAGDEVLIGISKRIMGTIRGGDTVARLGGDEFVVLLLGLEKGEECVATIERLLEAISNPFEIKGRRFTLGASIGVSIYPLDDEDADTLLRHADQAMYQAKQSGKNRFDIFDPSLDLRARDHREFMKSIRQAIEKGELELYYQPKINLKTRRMIGAEALLRWHHPERGLHSPAEFLHLVENTDLDVEIGEWVIESALAQLRKWMRAGLDLEVSINISAYHLESKGFVDMLKQKLDRYPDVPASRVQIEVLETAALADVSLVSEVIQSCRQFGVGFALDDFGTGYSSLAYLSRLPVDALKIDQSFIRGMLNDKGDMAIVQGIVALASAFGRQTIAEGIESDAHYAMLLEMGCDAGQGYGIARPMPAEELTNWRMK